MPHLPESRRRPWQPKRKAKGRRVKSNNNIYNSRRWRKARKLYLEKHPLCILCKKEARLTAADVVDHIKPINQGGAVWDQDNWQPLCHRHHNIKSGKEAHGTS